MGSLQDLLHTVCDTVVFYQAPTEMGIILLPEASMMGECG
jgi:hypothetical protein